MSVNVFVALLLLLVLAGIGWVFFVLAQEEKSTQSRPRPVLVTSISLSPHARRRMRQRGITEGEILACLNSSGATVTPSETRYLITADVRGEPLKVVVDAWPSATPTIITCMWDHEWTDVHVDPKLIPLVMGKKGARLNEIRTTYYPPDLIGTQVKSWVHVRDWGFGIQSEYRPYRDEVQAKILAIVKDKS